MAVTGRVIVYGGKGALGTKIVNFFRSKSWVCITLEEIRMVSRVNEFSLCSITVVRRVAMKLVSGISVLKFIRSVFICRRMNFVWSVGHSPFCLLCSH